MAGPLSGYRIIELAGIGPAPFGAMMLADMGAEVIRVDRLQAVDGPAIPGGDPSQDLLNRGRRSVAVDLKHPGGVATVLALVAHADALVEGFRPGVAERLGVGPGPCLERNPRLVYGRMTGWGQEGPKAHLPGHDINYLALSGTLSAIGRQGEAPVPPLNLVADFGGGGMLLAYGVVCALLEAGRSGTGQVIDVAMVDGSALLATMIHGFRSAGLWRDERGTNLLDTGAWFYEVYETADGGYLAVGALEPRFCAELIRLSGVGSDGCGNVAHQADLASWPAMKERLAAVFLTRTRDEWCELLEDSDACVAPVLGLGEAPGHPHNAHRGTFTEVSGVVQPAPAPRFSRTPGTIDRPPPRAGQHTDEVLGDWGLEQSHIDELRATGAIG
ncbi:MAG: alpha-methylacyl-CoA racemase [Acidimicrobiaceae bacterium]|nr:alpha-methylacyl-CoA racemase [Acidimicrobiaceae bacterium]MDQ1421079.1 alpha-methylacyl-CoA racemase [Acidimicrobiaceae bacterium]MDQ1440106.1 alpha-methylacyl-CoA racemase [Acidimicrobiaceae bacterium]